ncbi:MAG: NAD(P)H-dependent oxidoreductase subunit E [Dethiobacter sp.]|jgi:NADH-quinone oxidoreductase subunit E|nr:NAD(P)H-dependent oxidoreductase subunit E [Dethiobacter sp.]
MQQTAQQSLRRFAKVNEIIHKHGPVPAHLISILQDIQEEYRYLPEEILAYVATAMDISPAKVFGVATFYDYFSLVPKGKYLIKVCDGTACHVRKSQEIIEAIRRALSLSPHEESTQDLMFTLETVSCLGACGLAPVMLVNDRVHPKVTPAKVREIVNEIRLKEGGLIEE